MTTLAGPRCPTWCVGHALDHDYDGSTQVTHQRPVLASSDLHADLEWYEDLRSPDDSQYFEEPPCLVINHELILPITAATLDLLSRAVDAARLALADMTEPPPPPVAPALVEEDHVAMVQRLRHQGGETQRLTPYVQAAVCEEMHRRGLTALDVAREVGGVRVGWVEECLAADDLDVGTVMLLAIGLRMQGRALVGAAEAAWRCDRARGLRP